MTKIGFFNGLKEIGGTFVVVETERAKCMFDFGFAVADRLDSKVRLRKSRCAADHVRLGVLTPEDGIYEEETAKELGLKAYGQTDKTCFFVISHMHIDHMGGLGMLHPEIPVFMSSDSLKLYHALAECGETEIRPHENCIGIDNGGSFCVEDITVKVVSVDHDVVGACGFLIETADGVIAYTGDYRFHGFHPEVTKAYAESAKGADVLITEGVTVSFDDVDMLSLTEPEETIRTEESLLEEIKAFSAADDGLLVVNPYNRNVERMHRLLTMLQAEGRTLVMDGVQASYVSAFYPQDEICVYAKTANTWRPAQGMPREQQKTESETANSSVNWKLISREELLRNPRKYVLQMDYGDIYELLDLQGVTSRFIHMDGSPLGDYDPSFAKLHGLLEYLQIPCEHLGLGGHAKPYFIRYMVDTIAPKTLIPLHSFRPEQVNSEKAGTRILPEYGDWYRLENGTLKKES